MDGASAGVVSGAGGAVSGALLSASLSAALAAAVAKAAALATAAAFSAAGSSDGTLRKLMLWETQPPSETASKPMMAADLISALPASARQASPACPTLVGAHRHCRGDRHGRRRQFLNLEYPAAMLVPV